ncbi:hypothetical protein KC363_g233 [Hortaea werneckii]|nr:hypothetical protein KC363_g233 [Hortaea werneckii]
MACRSKLRYEKDVFPRSLSEEASIFFPRGVEMWNTRVLAMHAYYALRNVPSSSVMDGLRFSPFLFSALKSSKVIIWPCGRTQSLMVALGTPPQLDLLSFLLLWLLLIVTMRHALIHHRLPHPEVLLLGLAFHTGVRFEGGGVEACVWARSRGECGVGVDEIQTRTASKSGFRAYTEDGEARVFSNTVPEVIAGSRGR